MQRKSQPQELCRGEQPMRLHVSHFDPHSCSGKDFAPGGASGRNVAFVVE